MSLQHAYAVTNLLSGLAAAAFTWSTGGTTNRVYVNDGRMDKQFSPGSANNSCNVIIDMGAAVSVSAIAILNHNLGGATADPGELKIEAADDIAISVNVVTPWAQAGIALTAPKHKDHVFQFAQVSKRYWRITFVWSTGGDAYTLKVGEIFACSSVPLSRAMLYGNTKRLSYITSRFEGRNGEQRGHFIAGPIRGRDLPLEDLSESEELEVDVMFMATNGGTTSLLWIEKYASAVTTDEASQECIYGKFQEDEIEDVNFDYLRHTPSKLTIQSLAREVGS